MEKKINNDNKNESNNNYDNNIHYNLNFMNNQAYPLNNNKNQLLQSNSMDNQSLNNSLNINRPFNNVYNNYIIRKEQTPVINQKNMNNLNFTENTEINNNIYNNHNYNSHLNNFNNIDKNSYIEYNNIFKNNNYNNIPQINNNINNFNINNINQEKNIQKKNCKNKNNQKRNNYIPKNLINNSLQRQNFNNSNNSNKLKNNPSKDYLINEIPNKQFNNLLTLENQETLNKKGNSNNYSNSNSPNDEIDNNFNNIINDLNINFKENEENDKSINSNIFKPFHYIFNGNINEVIEILSNCDFYKNDCPKDIIDNINYNQNSNCDIVGNIISFRWKKFYTLELLCSKTFKSKAFRYYKLSLLNLKPVNIDAMELTFKYYYNTCQCKTHFIIEYNLDKGILSEVFKEEFLDIDINKICKSCQKLLNQRKNERVHISSIFFNSNKERAWNYLMNLNNNKCMNYMNEYELEYNSLNKNINNENKNENNMIKIGDIILIKTNKNKIIGKITIDNIKTDKNENELIISYNNNINDTNDDKNNKTEKTNNGNKNKIVDIINQKIILILREINQNYCFCEFKHVWEEKVNDDKINILNLLKNNTLILFKKDLELKNNVGDEKKQNNDEKIIENQTINIFKLICPIKK